MAEEVRPGRLSRVYRCRLCDADVSFSAGLEPGTAVMTLKGSCERGHPFSVSWALGEPPPTPPFRSLIEFVPFRRGV